MKDRTIKVTRPGDRDFPQKLLRIGKVPEAIYYLGALPKEELPAVAMVGARACSAHGRRSAGTVARQLSESGVQVISGMARGVDTQSHRGALEGGTPTFAVLGSGVDVCYPEENIELYEQILERGGGILSEYPPGEQPVSWHFPQRNRIISGLADLIVIVEAKQKSGSLITVEWALEQGKDVMAFPGRMEDPLSEGCNRLIKNGAGIVTEAKDIIELLEWEWKEGKSAVLKLQPEQAVIFSALGDEMKTLEEIVAVTKLDYESVLTGLLQLQIKGMIEQPLEHYYVKK